MLSNAKDILRRMNQSKVERMKDIYEECAKTGLQKRFVDAFYYRITEFPLKHTKSVIDTNGDIESLKLYLKILINKRPNDKMINEWKQSLYYIENK